MTRWLWSVSLGALALSPALAAAPAAEGFVKIIAPADGARLEERRMLERFGDAYAAYRQRVPMFFPRWRNFRELIAA